MRTHALRIVALLVVFIPLAGCGLSNEEAEPPQPAANPAAPEAGPEVVQPPADVIVFRGKYYQEKHCRKLPNGWACGPVKTVEVAEVLRGELKLKRLIDPRLPHGLKEGETYNFQWKRTDAVRKEVWAAEKQGFTGMWIDGEKLELVTP